MERVVKSSKVKEPKPLRWKKIGGGIFRYKNSYIKPGQIFEAFPEDIPEAFKDQIILLSDVPKKPVVKVEKPVYVKVPVVNEEAENGDEVLYNIVDSKGKKINDTPLSAEIADQFVKNLTE